MKLIFAKEIGFCFGVRRALKMIENNLSKMKKPIKMYGPLVHNEEVTERLRKKGIKIVNDLEKIKEGTLIISAHGLPQKIKNKLIRRRGLDLLDTTCPIVARVQKTAELLERESRQVLIFGDINHQEVLGIKGATKEKAIVFCSKEELLKFKPKKNKRYGLVVQTTQNFEKFKEIGKIAKKKIPQIEIFNTVCSASFKRQAEIRKLAKKVVAVLIIGSTTSANTKRLYQISSKINPRTFFVKTAKDLKREWFENIKNVGIGAGASTPDWIINKVVKKLKTYDSKKKNKEN
ncbi:4-hydroxy-3-methylbut-2-enyl diphosphate reductase [Patescibacteria group bacterium]|nr:4-hydroxy-3-methylbut-2-enyl diphosphate reductase [Patescibacteria group bacterium]